MRLICTKLAGFIQALCLVLVTMPAIAARSTALSHDAYVWQRVWTPSISEAVRTNGANFSELVILGAEVAWENGTPRASHTRIDFGALRQAGVPVGFALRVGAFGGPFATNDTTATLLCQLASDMISRVRSNGLTPMELQVDFDCAESKLNGYGLWIQAISARVSPLPVRITALPSWLNQPAFKSLASAAGEYVLQVHSLQRPKNVGAITKLCDPETARAAVEKAGRLGVPFRVALPTYSYLLAFGKDGQFIGLSAEGPAKSWPVDTVIREMATDPMEMAGLMSEWGKHRPECMRGVIWFRLPSDQDAFNWRWRTLDGIMHSQSLRKEIRVDLRRVDAGLIEIDLVNIGDIDISSRLAVEVHWQGARCVAADALGGFEVSNQEPTAARFQSNALPLRLRTGSRVTIGWIRLDQEREATGEVNYL